MGKEFNKVCCGQKPEQGAHSGVLAVIKSGKGSCRSGVLRA